MSNRNFPKPPRERPEAGYSKSLNDPFTTSPALSKGSSGSDDPFTTSPALQTIEPEDISFILQNHLRPEHRDDPRVIAFISSYVQYRDIRQASEEAGITKREGMLLSKRKDIRLAITKITETAVLKYGLDPEEIVAKVRDIAYLDPADLIDKETGCAIENIHDIPAEARRAIKKFKVKNLFETDDNGMRVMVGKLVEFEFYDKLKADEMLGREENLFKETKKLEHDVTSNMASVLLEARDRADQRAIAARESARLESGYKEVIEVDSE